MSNILDPFDMKQVTRFIDGLTKLSSDTGVTIFAESANASIQIGGEDTGLRLVDSDAENSGYSVEVHGA